MPSKRTVDRIRAAVQAYERRMPRPQNRRSKYPVGGGGMRILLAKCGSNVSKGSSGTFTIYDTSSDQTKGAETATSRTKTAYLRVGDYTANSWAYLVKFGNGWEVIQTECAE